MAKGKHVGRESDKKKARPDLFVETELLDAYLFRVRRLYVGEEVYIH